MDAARRTLGCWILSAFLQRGCDPSTARMPREVWSVRLLSPHEAAALTPLASLAALGLVLAPLTNLRWLPLPAGAGAAPAIGPGLPPARVVRAARAAAGR